MRQIKIKRILAYAEGEETRVLKYAADLAAKMKATLKIVDVLEGSHLNVMMSTSPSLGILVREAKQERLKKLALRLSTAGFKVRCELLEGRAETAITLEVQEGGHELLVIGSAVDAGRHLTTLGMRLLRQCPCPVWVAGSGRRCRVLAALDLMPGDSQKTSLNTKVLTLAASVARLCGGELHVLKAWHVYGESMLRGYRVGIRQSDVESYVQSTLATQTEEMEKFLKGVRTVLPADRIHLVKGEAGEVIPRFCKEKRMDVLVLGTIARTGLGAALIGNTAETVVAKVECSILAVKPDSFVCPVER